MITRDVMWQKFGSLKRELLSRETVTGEDALTDISEALTEFSDASVYTDDHGNLVLSLSLTEDIVFRVRQS